VIEQTEHSYRTAVCLKHVRSEIWSTVPRLCKWHSEPVSGVSNGGDVSACCRPTARLSADKSCVGTAVLSPAIQNILYSAVGMH